MNISARAILAGIWGAVIIAALAAPLLFSGSFPTASFFTYLPFSFTCHQLPERSFMLLDHPLAVCHRCSGIYLGLFLGTLLSPLFNRISPRARRACIISSSDIPTDTALISPRARRACIISASALLALDAVIPLTGLWSGFTLCRFLTGFIFGASAAPFAVIGLEEILMTIFGRRHVRDAEHTNVPCPQLRNH